LKTRTFFEKKVQPKNFQEREEAVLPLPSYLSLLFFLRRFFLFTEEKKAAQ
jgi:hypothetical protein